MKPKNVNCRKSILGKYEVTYDCPECDACLKSDLDDAGTNDTCPHCGCGFVVPGSTFRDQLNKKRLEKAEARRQREAEQKAEVEARRQREAEAEKAEAEKAKIDELKRIEQERCERRAQQEQAAIQKTIDMNREPIHHISKGLMHLVKAFAASLVIGILSILLVFGLSMQSAGFGFGGVIAVISAFGLVAFGAVYLSEAADAIKAFRKGSMP